MKRIGLILSFIFIGSCASGLDRFPAQYMYVTDLANSVCVKYKIIDFEKLIVSRESEASLVRGGDCDRMVGFHRNEFKPVQNWVRDSIEECKARP